VKLLILSPVRDGCQQVQMSAGLNDNELRDYTLHVAFDATAIYCYR
jgi:hypothetical protein